MFTKIPKKLLIDLTDKPIPNGKINFEITRVDYGKRLVNSFGRTSYRYDIEFRSPELNYRGKRSFRTKILIHWRLQWYFKRLIRNSLRETYRQARIENKSLSRRNTLDRHLQSISAEKIGISV